MPKMGTQSAFENANGYFSLLLARRNRRRRRRLASLPTTNHYRGRPQTHSRLFTCLRESLFTRIGESTFTTAQHGWTLRSGSIQFGQLFAAAPMRIANVSSSVTNKLAEASYRARASS